MQFRTAVESDLDRILSFGLDDPLSWPDPDRYRRGITDGAWRLSNTWLGFDHDRLVALGRWWTPPNSDKPASLDGLYVADFVSDRAAVAAQLLAEAHQRLGNAVDYHMFLPADWRDDDAAAQAVAWRREALAAVGMTKELERLRYAWTVGTSVAEPDPRLVFRPADDETFVDAFCQVSHGSLDVGTREGIAEHGVEGEARDHMGAYLSMRGDRGWWRLAYTAEGQLVGLAIPSANDGGPVVGYLGVVPQHRGHGYVDSLLAGITRCLADTGAQRVAADTDVTNTPMAASFERAGYAHFATRLVIGQLARDPRHAPSAGDRQCRLPPPEASDNDGEDARQLRLVERQRYISKTS